MWSEVAVADDVGPVPAEQCELAVERRKLVEVEQVQADVVTEDVLRGVTRACITSR